VFRSTRTALLACLAFASVAGYVVVGHYLYKLPIGLAPSAFLAGETFQDLFAPEGFTRSVAGLVWIVLSLIGIALATFLVFRRGGPAPGGLSAERRGFLASSGAAFASLLVAGAAGLARGFLGVGTSGGGWRVTSGALSPEVPLEHDEWKQAWRDSRVRSYRRLGRTGFEISDIVMGSGPLQEEGGDRIVRTALERGVNYIDTSPDYSAAGSEKAVGRGIKGFPRDQVFIATKFCEPLGHLPPGTPVSRYKEIVEGSLARLDTDYVDLVHIHSCDEVERLMDPNVHEAFDRLKEEGKARFLGFSTHTPRLAEVANTGIDSGRFDVMMLAYHYGGWPELGKIIERGRREQDMGVVAMKTLKGAKHHGLEGFREEADAFTQAALRWVLANQDVSCAVISMFELQHVDEYLVASGGTATARDEEILRKYDRLIAGTYCAPHCGACLDSCPEGLPIHDVLRQRMYFEDYGAQKEAMRLYARLEKQADVCASCSAPCLGSCPLGVPIQERMEGAHRLLSLG